MQFGSKHEQVEGRRNVRNVQRIICGLTGTHYVAICFRKLQKKIIIIISTYPAEGPGGSPVFQGAKRQRTFQANVCHMFL